MKKGEKLGYFLIQYNGNILKSKTRYRSLNEAVKECLGYSLLPNKLSILNYQKFTNQKDLAKAEKEIGCKKFALEQTKAAQIDDLIANYRNSVRQLLSIKNKLRIAKSLNLIPEDSTLENTKIWKKV